jgi:hypothetical protein
LKDRVLVGLLVLAAVLYGVGIDWGLPWNISWSIDDLSPWKPLSLPWRWFESWNKYPYLHWFLSLALYAPYLAWLAATGGLKVECLPTIEPWEGCFSDAHAAPTVLMLLTRLLSAAMALGCIAFVYALARELTGDRLAARLAAALAAVTSVLVLYAHLGNLDVPVTFWFTGSLLFAARITRRAVRRDYALFGLFSACALTTKDPILGAYLGTGLGLLAVHLRRGGRLFDRNLLTLLGVLLVVYGVVQNVLFNFEGFVDHWRFWLPTGEFIQGERRSSPGLLHTARRIAESWVSGAGAPIALLCVAGGVGALGLRRRVALLWIPIVSYLLVSVVLSAFAAERILLPVVVAAAVFGGWLAAHLLRLPRGRAAGGAVVAGALLHGLLYSVHIDGLLVRDGRYAAEAWFASSFDSALRVASCSAPVDLPRLDRQGILIEWVPHDEDCAAGLARLSPDRLLVSSASPRGHWRDPAGWRLVWEGTGHSPLERWFPSPYSWLNPRIRVLEPEAAPTPRRGR